ncbi:hypothetical protein ACIBQ1_24075 [Nonomuraea sp. NPDC050153]|uniref:hypothetical protein n=1 Tax=Nonomuraea sp. NPDC050153 TaxID=3364359 RepID=UPI0037A51A04
MPGKQRAATTVAEPPKTDSAAPSKVSEPAHPVAEAQGTDGNRAVAAALQQDAAPAPAQRVTAPAKPLADRQVRAIVLRKAEMVLEYRLGDGSTHKVAVISYADFPPGVYIARPLHGSALRWAYPPHLKAYVDETGRNYAVLLNRADHASNPGTFEGVGTFDFAVIGRRALPQGAWEPDAAALFNTAEIRRYLALRGSRAGRLPTRGQPDELPPEQVAAMSRFRDQLSRLTETDWAAFAREGPATGPVGTWVDAQQQLERYMESPERERILKAEDEREDRILAARAAIDLNKQAAAIDRLKGTGKLYDAIVDYEFTTSDNSPAWREAEVIQTLYEQLDAARFRTIAEFDAAALELRTMVQRQAVLRALLSLKEGERVLRTELQRYRNRNEVNRLAGAMLNLTEDPDTADAIKVRTEYPILRNTVVYKGAKASKYPENLEEMLLQNIEAQFRNVAKGREALHKDPKVVFNFDIVIGETLEGMGLPPDSVQAQLIRARRGADKPSILDVLKPILMVLCFAAGPLGWVAYAANLAALGIAVYEAHEKEGQKDLVRSVAHAGEQLASEPRIHGVMEAIGSFLEPLGIATGILGVFQLPKVHTPDLPAPGIRAPEAQAPEIRAPRTHTPEPAVPARTGPHAEPAHPGPATETPPVTAPAEAPPTIPPAETPPTAPLAEATPTRPAGPAAPAGRPAGSTGSMGAASVHDESFMGNRIYNDTISTPGVPKGPAGARRPVNGQRALDDSFPVQSGNPDPSAPVERIGVDVEHQELVVLTRVGQRVQGGQVVGGVYRGRVASWDELTPEMRKVLTAEKVRVDPSGKITVPEMWAGLDPAVARRVEFVPGLERAADLARPAKIKPPQGAGAASAAPAGTFTIDAPAGLTAAEKASGLPILREVKVKGPNGTSGIVERSWNPKTGTWSHAHARFDPDLPRWVDTDPPLVPGRGTPLETYLTLGLMNWFKKQGLAIAGERVVVIEGVSNLPSIAQLARAKMYGIPVERALRLTKTVQNAENSIVQSGGRITGVQLIDNGLTMPWKHVAGEAERAALLRDFDLELPLNTPVTRNYDVVLTVEPAVPKAPSGGAAPVAPTSGGGTGGGGVTGAGGGGGAGKATGKVEGLQESAVPRNRTTESKTWEQRRRDVTIEGPTWREEYGDAENVPAIVRAVPRRRGELPRTTGRLDVTWSRDSKTLVIENVRLEDTPTWIGNNPQLIRGKGVPLSTYLQLWARNWLKAKAGADFAMPHTVLIYKVEEAVTVAQLARAAARKTAPEVALPGTKMYQFAETAIVQSGGRIESFRLSSEGVETTWGKFAKPEDIRRVSEHPDFLHDMPAPDLPVRRSFDIELTVAPATLPEPPAQKPPVAP